MDWNSIPLVQNWARCILAVFACLLLPSAKTKAPVDNATTLPYEVTASFLYKKVEMIRLTVNGKEQELDVDPQTPLLWVLRERLRLTGTKFGCGMAQCGACTVHVNGTAQRSCVTPLAAVQGQQVTTIEGLAPSEDELHPLQQAWIDEQVPQCGYCQSGQLMSAASLLADNPNPSDEEINAAMQGNICRCGMYGRIKKAINRVAGVGYFDPARGEV